jgi:hypothetical protein
MPDPLAPGDAYAVRFDVGALKPQVVSLAGFAIAAETAGGARLGCADVYASPGLDLGSGCLNLLDSRGAEIAQISDVYTFGFGTFSSGRRTLLVVYGFSMAGQKGAPLGVSCVEIDVGEPGSGPRTVSGDKMRVLR